MDEAWVPSSYVKSAYEASGVPADKVVVIPNGIDETKFYPEAPPLLLKTNKRFKFLFVGGTIGRKGADVLLNAFAQTFSEEDDLCLVIKDFGGKSFYNGQTMKQTIQELQSRPNAPEILYLDDELSSDEMIGLYTAWIASASLSRRRIWVAVLEAMACGLPVICTGGGATDDFATDAFAYRLKSEAFEFGDQVNGEPLVHQGWLIEPSFTDLKKRLRWVFGHQDEARAMGLSSDMRMNAGAGRQLLKKLKYDLSILQNRHAEKGWRKTIIEPEKNRQAISVQALVAAIGIYEQDESPNYARY